MLKHLFRLAVAVILGILTYYTSYSILSTYDKHLATLAAFGLLFSIPLPLILVFYGKVKWAGRLFVGSWLAYGVAIASLIIWSALEAFPTDALAFSLVAGCSTLVFYALHRTGKIGELLQLLGRSKKAGEEPEVHPVIGLEGDLMSKTENKSQTKQESAFELELEEPQPAMEERNEVFDLGELTSSLDGLDCKILLVLMTNGSVLSKKELKLATGASYKRVLSSTKRLQESGLIEVRREVIRGRKGAVIRHSIDLTSNLDRKRLESLVRQRMEKLEKWGVTEA